MTRFFKTILVALPVAALACSSGNVAVGTSEQQLVRQNDGDPTGNGKTCSWDDAVSFDARTGQQTVHSGPNGQYNVGDTFKSTDGCNDCTCTVDGIACTRRACAPGDQPGGCPEDARVCPDGTTLTRSEPNCQFPACPGEVKGCTAEAKICPDGTAVGRTGPNCEFAPCP
jgi:hypothetical protein